MDKRLSPYEQASSVLPAHLRRCAQELTSIQKAGAEELRLRLGYPVSFLFRGRESDLPASPSVTEDDLRRVLEIASQASVHTVLERIRQGFVTIRGGHRIGLCGTAVVEQGSILNLRFLSSLSIRICRPVTGISDPLIPQLLDCGTLQNTLILAPPGAGKTTLLRDIIKNLSDGLSVPPMRVGVADERGELAAVWEGRAELDLGRHTDVMDGCPKALGLQFLLRGMNPQVLATDEITSPEDIEAARQAVGCGVALVTTAHGSSVKEFSLRPIYRSILQEHLFQRVVLIRRSADGTRRFCVEELS